VVSAPSSLSELLDVARDCSLGGAIDPDGRLHDVVMLVMPLRRWRSSADF